MNPPPKCPVCGSDKLVPDLTVAPHSFSHFNDSAVFVEEKPDALVFKGAKKFTLLASVCGSCGHVMLSVANPEELWKTWQANQPQ